MSDWLTDQYSEPWQEATLPDKNTTALSDVAFQSYLQNAPIPRIFLEKQTGQTAANVTPTNITWGEAARIYDPYNMHNGSINTAIVTIPVAGFYSFFCNIEYNSSQVNLRHYVRFLVNASKTYIAAAQLAGQESVDGNAVSPGRLNVSMNRFFDAGDSFYVEVLQSSTITLTTQTSGFCVLGGCWVAPYKPYTTTGGN